MSKKYIAGIMLASLLVSSGYAMPDVGRAATNGGSTDVTVEVVTKPEPPKPEPPKPEPPKPEPPKPEPPKPEPPKPEPPVEDDSDYRPSDGSHKPSKKPDSNKGHDGNPLGGKDGHKNDILTNDSRVKADPTYINFGYIKGYPNKTFQPDRGLSREEYAEIVNRLLQFEPTMNNISFVDVAQNRWSYRSIVEMANYGILVGTGNGRYEPERKITKEEAAIIIDRIIYSDYVKDTIPSQAKVEVKGSDEGKKALSRLYNMGIIDSLVENKVIDGNEVIDRWQIVTVLNKLIYTDLKNDKVNKFSDITDKDKYFKDVMKASMSVID